MKKWLVRISLGNLIVFGLVYIFLLYRSDTTVPVHDDQLRSERASIPAGSNAFDVLQSAGRHLWWPDNQNRALSELAHDTNWDDTLANTLLSSNREALAGWDAAAKLPEFQVPEATNLVVLPLSLAVWKDLAQIAEVRENALMRNGHDQESFDDILGDVRMCHRMQNSHGILLCYFVSVAVGRIGLSQIPRWLGRTHLGTNQLNNYLQQLSFDPNGDGIAYANTIKAEYKCQLGTLEAVGDGRMDAPVTDSFSARLWPLLPVFNFSETKALFANASLLLVKAAPHHFNETELPDLVSNRPGLISMFLSGNAIGQVLYYMQMPEVMQTLASKSRASVALQAIRVILALRAYQLVHGQLPANLSEFVPEFLDQVPTDDFNGRPLRYCGERKIVYSVGKNLKDDGGDESRGNPPHPPLDLVCHFNF